MAFKILMLGATEVGKTQLFNRIAKRGFTENYTATVGMDFANIIRGDTSKSFGLWDLADQDRYQSIVTPHYRTADIAILCFDPRNQASFERLKQEIIALNLACKKDCQFILVETKSDILDEPMEVRAEDIEEFKTQYNLQCHVKTSAKDEQGAEPLIEAIDFSINKLISQRKKKPGSTELGDLRDLAQPQSKQDNSSFWLDALFAVAAVGTIGLAIGAVVGALVAALVVASVPLAIGLGVGLGAGAVVAGAVAIGTFFYRRSEEKQPLADKSLETVTGQLHPQGR